MMILLGFPVLKYGVRLHSKVPKLDEIVHWEYFEEAMINNGIDPTIFGCVLELLTYLGSSARSIDEPKLYGPLRLLKLPKGLLILSLRRE
jgi:hypothetical protein